MRYWKRVKPHWIVAGLLLGTFAAIAYAQVRDNNNHIWGGTHTFNAPVTFSDTVTGVTLSGVISAADGSSTTPAYAFANDADTGMYLQTGGGDLRWTVAGTDRLRITSGAFTVTPDIRITDGSVSSPGLNFSSDADTGIYRPATDQVAVAAGGVQGALFLTNSITFTSGFRHLSFRDEFDYHCFVAEQADDTAELVTDNGENHAACRHSIDSKLLYQFKLDGAQASPFIISGGQLDIDNDAGAGEGVNMVFARDPQTTGGYQFGVAYYARFGIEVGDVSDLAVFHFGWRLNEDHIDDQVLATQDTYASFSSPAGTTSATAATDGTDQTELEATCDIADGETWIFEVRVSATGVPTYYCVQDTEASLALLTTGTAVGPFASGDVMVPYIAYVGTAGTTEIKLDFIEVGLN